MRMSVVSTWVSLCSVMSGVISLIAHTGQHVNSVIHMTQQDRENKATEVEKVTVFNHGEAGYNCIRIPSLCRCGNKHTLHAFAECRPQIGDGCYPDKLNQGPFAPLGRTICYKRSVDDGATWSQLVSVAEFGWNPTCVCEHTHNHLLLQYDTEGGGNVTKYATWQLRSTDDGASWSQPQYIDLGHYGIGNPGPGQGIQLSTASPAPGRILFIGHIPNNRYAFVWYSDDLGHTYRISETIIEHVGESQLVETSEGYVLANMRNRHLDPCGCRAIAVSKDGGKTFSNITFDPTLISPGPNGCQATIIRLTNGSLVFANPANNTQRVHGLLRRSDDNGHTWPHSYLVTTGGYAYSCLSLVSNDNQVGLLWETQSDHCTGPSCQIAFSKINVL